MDCFKHSSTASRSAHLAIIMDDFGLEGYARWFLLMEIVAEKMSKGVAVINSRLLSVKLRADCYEIALFLDSIVSITGVKYKIDGDDYIIEMPEVIPVKAKDAKIECKFDLDKIYAHYPKKRGKKAGMRSLASQIKTEKKYDQFRAAAWNYIKRCEAENIDQQFILHFSSFATTWEEWVDYRPGDKAPETKDIGSRIRQIAAHCYRRMSLDDLAEYKKTFSEKELDVIDKYGGLIGLSESESEYKLSATIKAIIETLKSN